MVSSVLQVAGSLLGSNKAANAAKDASYLQADAANRSREQEMAMFEQNRADMAPWRDEGKKALLRLSDLLGTSGNSGAEGFGSLAKPFTMTDFTEDPGYQFRMQEGAKALERSAASKGKLFSGAQGKALTGYNQNLASEEYGKAYDRFNTNMSNLYSRLSGQAGTGQTAGAQIANLGATTSRSMSDLITGGANALGAGQVGAGNAWNTGLQGIGQTLGDLFSNQQGGKPAPSTQPGTFWDTDY